MSAVGYPDYQRITQWLGAPLVQGTGVVVGVGTHTDGPLEVANFASVIVALKATGGPVTVRIKQTVPGGPASLLLTEDVLVPAGATLFEAFVLFGSAVELDIIGTVGGTTVDYALYGSNTTTNAQVITSATINLQQNDALVAAEPTLDFEDAVGWPWTITDDAPNTRVKVSLPTPGLVKLWDSTESGIVFPTASVTTPALPQTFKHLVVEVECRGSDAVAAAALGVRMNGDAGAHYDSSVVYATGVNPGNGGGAFGATSYSFDIPANTALANMFAYINFRFADYTNVARFKAMVSTFLTQWASAAGSIESGLLAGTWLQTAAISTLTFFDKTGGNLVAGTRITVYGEA